MGSGLRVTAPPFDVLARRRPPCNLFLNLRVRQPAGPFGAGAGAAPLKRLLCLAVYADRPIRLVARRPGDVAITVADPAAERLASAWRPPWRGLDDILPRWLGCAGQSRRLLRVPTRQPTTGAGRGVVTAHALALCVAHLCGRNGQSSGTAERPSWPARPDIHLGEPLAAAPLLQPPLVPGLIAALCR